jgi:hypothetical protein
LALKSGQADLNADLSARGGGGSGLPGCIIGGWGAMGGRGRAVEAVLLQLTRHEEQPRAGEHHHHVAGDRSGIVDASVHFVVDAAVGAADEVSDAVVRAHSFHGEQRAASTAP